MSSRPAYATMSTVSKHKNLQKPEISLDKMPMSTLKYPESLIIRNMQIKIPMGTTSNHSIRPEQGEMGVQVYCWSE